MPQMMPIAWTQMFMITLMVMMSTMFSTFPNFTKSLPNPSTHSTPKVNKWLW